MQQQEKLVLGLSLVVTLMAGWVQVGEASAVAQDSFPRCVPNADCDDADEACGGKGWIGDCLDLGACAEGQSSLFCMKS